MTEKVRNTTPEANKKRVEHLFQFARAYSKSQNRTVRSLTEHPFPNVQIDWKSLPQESEWITHWSGGEENREWLLKVKICPPTPCPKPPDVLKDWLLSGWEKHSEKVRFIQEKFIREYEIERFDDSSKRLEYRDLWEEARESWVKEQKRHDPVRSLFSQLQTLSAELSKGSGEIELFLGVGIFEYKTDKNNYKHPLFIKSVGLEFDADKNIFTVIETERPTELYIDLLHDFNSLDLSVSTHWRDRLSLLHPLDRDIISMLSSIRDWLRNQKDLEKAEITESPVIFMRNRGGWTSRAADDVLKNLALRSEKDLPAYLLQLAGADIPKKSYVERYPSQSELVVANETADVLFALPANLEQLQLAKTIEHKDIILVQGPPGTGKTHTIANLLGHLLSQGKRVLVTSHTSKALKVLRDKVPTNIQSLCVSVLDNVSNNKKELEQSVEAIAQKMEQGTIFLEREAKKLEEERASLLSEIQKSRKLQQSCVHREYESIVIGGESISPIDAAKEVDVGRKIHDWIPGPLEQNELGKVCSVSVSDLMWIYSSQKNINQDDEITLRKGVLSYTEIRKPIQFNEWIDALDKNREITKELSHSLWNKIKPKTEDLKKIQICIQTALDQLTQLEKHGEWMTYLVEEGADSAMPVVWNELFRHSNALAEKERQFQPILLKYAPSVPDKLVNDETYKTLKKMLLHMKEGKGFSSFSIFIAGQWDGKWKFILDTIRCNEEKITHAEQLESVIQYITLALYRRRIINLWNRQVVSIGGQKISELKPEKISEQWIPFMKAALGWFDQYWKPVKMAVSSIGQTWDDLEKLIPPNSSKIPRLTRTRQLAKNQLLPACSFHLADIQIQKIEYELEKFNEKLNIYPDTKVVSILKDAIIKRNTTLYETAYKELVRLNTLQLDFEKRIQLLQKLEKSASRWAEQLRLRSAGFDMPLKSDIDIQKAWRWRQFQDELEKRSHLDSKKIAQDLQNQTEKLQYITKELIAVQCWHQQLAAAEKFRPHLVGWLASMRRIGKGTGKLVESHRRAAREQLKMGQKAIPVWIMPLAEVFRSFSVNDQFDVVIIDEASQAGIEGLFAAYMGKKVIIVGDHEQVSPDAVGQESNIVQALQQQFLDGIPNANLYDGKLSLYDMSRWGADGILSLKEHFRCMPSIIGFSNQLSYGGRIKPLRDSNSSNLLPVIPLRVEGVRSGKQKTNPEEAIQIVALIKAMCENSAYTNSTIGVISLLGTEQATYIEVLIHKHISTKDIEKRQIICGNAAQFQGDERDIIFLSMVDSNEGDGPIRKQGEGANDLYKKRYNVAASRAKNQMWVVHSMDYQTDLKPDDIRRQLLDYCYSVSRKSTESIDAHRTDSEFERLVLKELLQRGYQVTTQYEVGAYRIDMVVEYEGRRLAIECDGEKWHSGTEKIAEDFARQAILERLGWKFHRIRGSCFFRERASAIQKLIDSLNELDIQPKINTIVVQDNLRENSIHQDIIRIAESFLLEIN